MARWYSTGSTVNSIVPTKSSTLTPVGLDFRLTLVIVGFLPIERDLVCLSLVLSAMVLI